ncbi:hypothetical protein N7481_013379 [Penicillium waksmanii]|uniref:uncharacterized protein n=1 Tax=Penicillium waksmanii TaxID=69791 RepID=UPI0025498CEE|nr:uncharacterized protein N7481_013379 [Penicillium waksmanii]KAJ5963074.1 hypothetical protein N7481_013379 [Penicillium waksmanii]
MTAEVKQRSKLWLYLMENIKEDILLECELVLLSFATGIQDAASWMDYGCFASNQTGNMLFLAIGAAQPKAIEYSMSHVGMSLWAFVVGGLVMGQIGNFFGARKRLWLITSSALQTALVYAAAAIQHASSTHQNGPAALSVIFLLAFSSGAQVALGRSLKVTDITTAMATAAFVDIAIDPRLLGLRNRQRNRRVMFLLMLMAGCIAGTFVQTAVGSSFTILLCAIGKTIVTFTFLLNRPIKEGG